MIQGMRQASLEARHVSSMSVFPGPGAGLGLHCIQEEPGGRVVSQVARCQAKGQLGRTGDL